jgi:hypothetical protein
MKWTAKGVSAIAAIETARRNGELERWQKEGEMLSWKKLISEAA